MKAYMTRDTEGMLRLWLGRKPERVPSFGDWRQDHPWDSIRVKDEVGEFDAVKWEDEPREVKISLC